MKAKLPPEVRAGDGSELATKDIYICPSCGACHEGQVERCHACNSPMAGELPVPRTPMAATSEWTFGGSAVTLVGYQRSRTSW
jgi:hypothetical protein